jgi:hypothetical protein
MPTEIEPCALAPAGESIRAPATTAAPMLFRKTRVSFILVPCLGSFGGCIELFGSVARTPKRERTRVSELPGKLC